MRRFFSSNPYRNEWNNTLILQGNSENDIEPGKNNLIIDLFNEEQIKQNNSRRKLVRWK